MPPCLSLRDWYECGKTRLCGRVFSSLYLRTPVCPFHAEPLQTEGFHPILGQKDLIAFLFQP